MTTDDRPFRDRVQPAATWVGTDRPAAVYPPSPRRCRAQHPHSNYEPGARIVECDLPAGHTGYHVEAGGGVSWPPAPPATAPPSSDAGWLDIASTELTAEQKIRAEALKCAVNAVYEAPGTELNRETTR